MSADLKITKLDPFDDGEYDQWHAVYAAAEAEGRPTTATPWDHHEMRVGLQERTERRFQFGWCGRIEGQMVAVGWARGHQRDNLHLLEVAAHTAPAHRRRGFGAEMVAHLEEFARGRDRTTLIGEVAWPYDGDPQGRGEAYVEFARNCGYTLALGDVQRHLYLPVAEQTLDRLAAEAATRHAGYTLRSWLGRVPDELVEGWVALSASLMTEAPTGAIDREPQIPDVAGFRESEALTVTQGREVFCAVALDSHGEVVANTDIAVSPGSPRAFQWGTVVRADHRGHRLGLAVKVANLRQIQALRPELASIVTWNADVNAHMIGVNEQLGFVPTERLGEVQKKLR